ncbi:MAG: P-II family nitrogen regulator [Thaumarchaeota archaeon]|nr:P-II family nitrogen regulator [Nitrososphaerota archaeon]
MKQVEAIIQNDKRSAVIDAIEKEGVGGITVLPANGRGKGQRPMIEQARGTGRHISYFNSLDAIFTVVEDSKVDAVVSAITDAASTGSKGDGKIFISTIDETVDIGSKVKGAQAL